MNIKGLEHIGEMSTLSEVINVLVSRGYTVDFNLKGMVKADEGSDIQKYPENFLIDGFYRFEGQSDPEDEAIVYAISSIDRKNMGILVNGYGVSSQKFGEELIKKLKTRCEN